MNYTSHKTSIKTIKPGHPLFEIKDGLVISPRAGFEISCRCPENYKDIILECIKHGWLKPVAMMSERELAISGLIQN